MINVGTNLAENLPATATKSSKYFPKINNAFAAELSFTEIGTAVTLKIIDSFSNKKATEPDGILMQALKDNKLTLAPLITCLANLMIKTSIFPVCLKIARVKPLFKKGDKTRSNNYRPISILNLTSKVLEKLLSMQIREYLERKNLLTNYQFGFRSKLSTTDAINIIMEQLYNNFYDRGITEGVILDF